MLMSLLAVALMDRSGTHFGAIAVLAVERVYGE